MTRHRRMFWLVIISFMGCDFISSQHAAASDVNLNKLTGMPKKEPVELITRTTLSIVVPKTSSASESLRDFVKVHKIKTRSKKSGSSWLVGIEEDADDDDGDHGEEDDGSTFDYDQEVSEDNINILEYEVAPGKVKSFEKFIESLALPSFGIQRSAKKVQKRVSVQNNGESTLFINRIYEIEIREVAFFKPSLSMMCLLTSVDNTLYAGGAIGAHTAGASPGISIGLLRGSNRRSLIFADITNYERIGYLNAFNGRLAPVVGYDLGAIRVDHQTFGMAGVTLGPSFTNYKNYSVSLLTKILALISQDDAKIIYVHGLESRVYF